MALIFTAPLRGQNVTRGLTVFFTVFFLTVYYWSPSLDYEYRSQSHIIHFQVDDELNKVHFLVWTLIVRVIECSTKTNAQGS